MSAPAGLQLDLLTAIVRLEQIRDEAMEPTTDARLPWLLTDRVFTCDIPRLRGYLTPETLAWEAEMSDEIRNGQEGKQARIRARHDREGDR